MSQGLWSQIANRHQNKKQNVASDNSNNTMLYNLLTNDKVKAQQQGSDTDIGGGLANIGKAAKTIFGSGSTGSSSMPAQYGFDNLGSLAASTGTASSVPSQYRFDSLGSLGSSSSSVPSQYSFDSFLTNSGSTGATEATKSGGLFGGSGSGGGSSVPWALIGKVAKEGYNGISGHDDKEYSDVEESVIYPLQGASMGSMFGPWGAAAGALYGLGYSFKDDLGMKNSNFLTQMLFPIGMGDGGGLRISGKPILDLG